MFVVGWRVVVMARQPTNIFKIANEIGSVAQTREGVYPNRSGSSVVFYQETETGMGTYLHVIQMGKTHLLYEQPEKGYGEQYRRIGWSPDEKYFVYAAFADESDTNGSKAIILCDGNSGETKARIPSEAYARDSQFLWLTPRSFIYSTFSQRSWLVFEQDSSGKWNQSV
jgi:hypothetical protein